MFSKAYSWFSHSLANQLLFTYLLIIAFALGVVTFWALLTIKSESIRDLRNSLEVEAVHLALEIDTDLKLDSAQAIDRIKQAVIRHAERLGLSIAVVSRSGHVLAESGSRQVTEGQNISNYPEINDALSGVNAIYTRSLPETLSDWLYVAYPVRAEGETQGVIRVGMPLTEINQRLHKDLFVFLQIIVATLISTVLISLWLARRVTKPISRMSETAKQIALSGDFHSDVPVVRLDEIGELGASFNQMIKRLREQERLRQEFIANASHELKTPVMAIGSVVEALQAGAGEDPELRRKFLSSLENLADRQALLIKDLLDVAKLDAEKTSGWNEPVVLEEILLEVIDDVRPHAEKKGVLVRLECLAHNLITSGNAVQLHQALSNLLINAINYSPHGSFVKVELLPSLNEHQAAIRFIDSGTGIDPLELPHIFERFYRGDKARTRASGGSGLGLAIAREIINRHQGGIEVSSEPGKGSVFTVWLPAYNNDEGGSRGDC